MPADAAATVASPATLTGTTPVLVTGDNARAAAHVAGRAGITGLLPRDKVGVAHSGIAMGPAGSDLALETADAVVVRDEPAAVPAAVALSRRAGRLITQNLVIAGVFITGLVIWDLTGRDGRRGPRGALPEGTPPRERDASLRESTDPECAFSGSSMNVILAEINR